jgi:hypothetical protein
VGTPTLVLILRTGEVFENGLGHVSGSWVTAEAPVVVEWSKECTTATLLAALISLPDSWLGRPSVEVKLTRSGARPGVTYDSICVCQVSLHLRPNISSHTSRRNAQSRAVVFAPPDLTSEVLRAVTMAVSYSMWPAISIVSWIRYVSHTSGSWERTSSMTRLMSGRFEEMGR